MSDVTRILSEIQQGDRQAAEQLLPLVYDELRKLAAAKLANELPGHTLQATALVHEAYLRLVDTEKAQHWDSRGHFFSAAAEAMRRILVETARKREREKWGGNWHRVELGDSHLGSGFPIAQLLAIDEALDRLTQCDPQIAELVKLHCFAGLPIEQVGNALGIPARTAYRNWAYARAWLFRELQSDIEDTSGS
jgi:RNA polymerase sigma factor (TIGR02999 family)